MTCKCSQGCKPLHINLLPRHIELLVRLLARSITLEVHRWDMLGNLKGDYFLKKFFGYLKEKKLLDIIKYNKTLQKKMNIDINAYKEYSEQYSSIEIEIIPAKNHYGKFISDDIYAHIFFDDDKEIKKRNYLEQNEEVKKIKVIIDYKYNSFENLFSDCNSIESICFRKFRRNTIENMSGMFSGCSSLKELNLSNFNTDNVTNMSSMFSDCSSLNELNLSNFNTNNVTNMRRMFSDCSSLNELNVSNFNTNNVTNMSCMFYQCKSLKELNVSNFNTSKVNNMKQLFSDCSSLKELDVSNFNFDKVKDMREMFFKCTSLEKLNFPNFIKKTNAYMNDMFAGCISDLQSKIREKCPNLKRNAFC